MMDEDYTHWICIDRATTISNDSTKQKKNAKIYWCTFPIIMHQYIHVHVYNWVVYIQWFTFFCQYMVAQRSTFLISCLVRFVMFTYSGFKKKLRKKNHLPTNIDIAPQLGSVTICDILLTSRISSVISI